MSCSLGPHLAGDLREHFGTPAALSAPHGPSYQHSTLRHLVQGASCRHQDEQHTSLLEKTDPVTTAALGSGAPREPEMVTRAQTAEQAGGRQTTEVLLTRQVCASVRPDCQQRRNSKLAGWVLWHLGCLPDTVEMACGQRGIPRERSRVEAYIWIAQQRPTIWAKCKAPKEPAIERRVEEGEWSQERGSTAMRQETTGTWVPGHPERRGSGSEGCGSPEQLGQWGVDGGTGWALGRAAGSHRGAKADRVL